MNLIDKILGYFGRDRKNKTPVSKDISGINVKPPVGKSAVAAPYQRSYSAPLSTYHEPMAAADDTLDLVIPAIVVESITSDQIDSQQHLAQPFVSPDPEPQPYVASDPAPEPYCAPTETYSAPDTTYSAPDSSYTDTSSSTDCSSTTGD
jgi:hypothetical protein